MNSQTSLYAWPSPGAAHRAVDESRPASTGQDAAAPVRCGSGSPCGSQWLEREANLPDSIKTYFWKKLERVADAVLPQAERERLLGCTAVSRYREAFNLHFARRRNETR